MKKTKKEEPKYRLETDLPLAGAGRELTLKEWKRIYGREPYSPFGGKLVKVDNPAPSN